MAGVAAARSVELDGEIHRSTHRNPRPRRAGPLVAGAAGPRIYIRMRHRDAAKLRELRDQIELQRDRESDRPETGVAGP